MERRRQDAIEEIVLVALELIDRDGFDATSVESIAAAAGCAPRTFYRYFGTKENVLFHDVPARLDELMEKLDESLAAGAPVWESVSEAVTEFVTRFDATENHPPTGTRRMTLWRKEPALRARYLEYVIEAEQRITASIGRHRGTDPETDDLAQLIAVAATGAARTAVFTHASPEHDGEQLQQHLRASLAVFARGLADL